MKWIISIIIFVALLFCLQFLVYRSLPILGAFPTIEGNLILKPDNSVILKIRQRGTYSISSISLYDGNNLLFQESDNDDMKNALIKLPEDWPKREVAYTERVVFITFPKDSYKKMSFKNGMVLKLQCYGSYDQYLTASGGILESKCIVSDER